MQEKVDIRYLDSDALKNQFPWLNTEDLAGGTFGESGEGWIDPHALIQGFKRKAMMQGVRYLKNEVVGFDLLNRSINRIHLSDKGQIKPKWVINAAGPQAKIIARQAGVFLPVESRKRQVHVFRCAHSLPDAPLLIDPTGVYFRPEGKLFICGKSPHPDQDPECEDFNLNLNQFEEDIWPILAHRVPIFEAIRREHSWAGHYAVNTIDHNVMVGHHPDLNNFILANGFSGHGLQQAPAIGRAMAELLVDGRYIEIDLTQLSFDRIKTGRIVVEESVV